MGYPYYINDIERCFWLHVRDDGVELRQPDEGTLPSLRVTVMKVGFWPSRLVEEARTRNIVGCDPSTPMPIRPRGEGWELYASTKDWTVWRRDHIPSGPKIITTQSR